jgi:mRNA degradation ribonuclease J1/J2
MWSGLKLVHPNPHVFKPLICLLTYIHIQLEMRGKMLEQKWRMMDVIASHKKVTYTFIISDQVENSDRMHYENSTKKKYVMNVHGLNRSSHSVNKIWTRDSIKTVPLVKHKSIWTLRKKEKENDQIKIITLIFKSSY